MSAGPVAVQFEEQPLLVEHDSREDGNGPAKPGATAGTRTPFPWRKIMTLMALNAVCPLAFELIYPFINS